MENSNKKTTAENQKLNSQKNASATKNNLFSAGGKITIEPNKGKKAVCSFCKRPRN